jgi:hypothetical protein
MASDASKELKAAGGSQPSNMPKHKQLVRMLSFRVVPAYYREIEKVANHKKMTVSKLIRSYIKEGMKRDNELTNAEDQEFRVD